MKKIVKITLPLDGIEMFHRHSCTPPSLPDNWAVLFKDKFPPGFVPVVLKAETK